MVLLPNDNTCYTKDDLKALNLLQHPVWVFDSERKEMFWANVASLAVWNASSVEELLSRDFASDIQEATEIRMMDQLLLLKEGGTTKEQWTIYPNGGAGRTMCICSSGIRINDGRIAALVEGELPGADSHQQDSTLAAETLRHIPLPCSRFDADGTVQYQNPETIQVFGSTTGTAKNKENFVSRFLDRELGKSVLTKAQAGIETRPTEAELYTKKGPRWFAVRARRARNPVSKRKETEYMIVDTARDITEIKQAKKDTKRARIKTDFLAQIAHEIRTPLHQVVGNLDLLELQNLSKQQHETVHTVQSSINQLMEIISDMLDYSKLESGMMKLDQVPFALQSLVDSSVSAIRQELEEKNLKFVFDFIDHSSSNLAQKLPASLMGDPNRLRQILQNFLDNAVKFTEKGTVTLRIKTVERSPDKTSVSDPDKTKSEQGTLLSSSESRQPQINPNERPTTLQFLRFEIEDTGIGMDETQKVSVFEQYQQAHAGIRANYGGVGLGLAICKHLVGLMQGRLGVDSELHKGTVAWFEVPLKVPSTAINKIQQEQHTIKPPAEDIKPYTKDAAAESTPANPFAEELRSLNVLVAEDNKINQKMVRSMLQRIGHKVTVAENGQVCLDALSKSPNGEPFDLVLMDIQMPVYVF